MKKCYECERILPLEMFTPSSLKCYRYKCKECNKKYLKQYCDKNKNKIKETRKKRYENNKTEILSSQRSHYRTNIKRYMLGNARRRAKKKNLEFNITVDDIVMVDVCPVLGIPLYIGDDKQCDNSPSLDRIDNSKGYIKENILVISWRANCIKGDANISELRKIIEYMQDKEA